MQEAVVADVHYGEWAGAAVLHRAIQHEGVWGVYAGRCVADGVARDLEWGGVSAVSGGAADGCAAAGLWELRVAMELVGNRG